MLNEIIKRVWIGNTQDAQLWPRDDEHFIVCALEKLPIDEPPGALWVRLGEPPRQANLRAAAGVVNAAYLQGKHVLIHDESGDQRSAAVVAMFFKMFGNVSAADAIAHIAAKRPTAVVDPSLLE